MFKVGSLIIVYNSNGLFSRICEKRNATYQYILRSDGKTGILIKRKDLVISTYMISIEVFLIHRR